jgi:hypothetical protein
MEHTIRRYDAHMHSLFKEVRQMWKNYENFRIYYSTFPQHQYIIGGLNKNNDELWESSGRKSPFEYVREKVNSEGIHIKCKKISYPEHTEYHLIVEEYDTAKIIPEPHQETTDKKYAKYVREYDTMKHQLYDFVKFLVTKAEETQQPAEWNVSSDFENSLRVVGALDKANEHKWEYIKRPSPFLAVRKNIMNETKYHVSSKYLGKRMTQDREILTFNVKVTKQQTQVESLEQQAPVESQEQQPLVESQEQQQGESLDKNFVDF